MISGSAFYSFKFKIFLIKNINRGYGYFIGIDFVTDRNTREPDIKNSRIILEKYVQNNINFIIFNNNNNNFKIISE